MQDKIIRKAIKGNKKAFEELIHLYKIDAYKVAYSLLHHEEDSKDAVCNAIEKAYKNIKSLKNFDSFKSWFLKIVVNESKMLIRKNVNYEVIPIETLYKKQESKVEISSIKLDINDCLLKLENFERSLVILKYYMEYTFKEIGEMYNMPESTVKTKIYSSLEIMRSDLLKGGYYNEKSR